MKNRFKNISLFAMLFALVVILVLAVCCNNEKDEFGIEKDFILENQKETVYAEQVSYRPAVTMSLENPRIINDKYILDVVATCDTAAEIFGMNFRLFYEAKDFNNTIVLKNFVAGYGLTSLGQPKVATGNYYSRTLLGFKSPFRYVNGAVQINNKDSIPIILDKIIPKKLFEMELTKLQSDPIILCSPIVYEKLNPPQLGGMLTGSDGVVCTVYMGGDRILSKPSYVLTINRNWQQFQEVIKGKYPYGQLTQCN